MWHTLLSENLRLNVIAANNLGGKLIALSGPCFDHNSTITCQFGDVQSEGVAASSLLAYCVLPMSDQYGISTFTVTVGTNLYNTTFTLREYTGSKWLTWVWSKGQREEAWHS